MTEKIRERISIEGETLLVAWAALAIAFLSLTYCFRHRLLLLYGDAVAHLYIARRIFDSLNPGFRQLGSVWLPLPHILLLPFVHNDYWWRTGLAGAWLSIPSYVLGCAGIYRLARLWLPLPAALVAAAFYALNPGLLYMSTTAMTEPLFLAEIIWAVVLIVQYQRAVEVPPQPSLDKKAATAPGSLPGTQEHRVSAERLLLRAGLVLVAAIFTRYDGWVFAGAGWLFVTWTVIARNNWKKRIGGIWVLFTALLIAAPASWLAYNARQFGDPLDFMRGPYSARAIEARTSPPGAALHPGFHNMHDSTLYYLKAAEMGAIPVRFGNALLWLSIAGTLAAGYLFRHQNIWPLLLLWLPWPFYTYSIAYGSVPIFIPIWRPFSWYNTRYGMELLPAFAIFSAAFVALLWVGGRNFPRWLVALPLLLIALDSFLLLRSGPLVYREAVVNSRTRIAFEHALANAFLALPDRGLMLMYTSKDVGAVQLSGIPLRRIVNEGDYYQWRAALEDPAKAAPIVIAFDGDPVAQAIHEHPQGLRLTNVICTTGQACARIYRSDLYGAR